MKSPAYLIRHSFVVLAAILLVSGSAVRGQPAAPPADNSNSKRELNLLVLGDSILWGQGLKQEHKSWYLVKSWLEQTNDLLVREKIQAHAGAVIGAAGTSPPRTLTVHGEINSGWPTLHDQIEDALRLFADPSQVDLVLVNGCINDVNARKFLNAGIKQETIKELAREKCGAPVETLLTRIASTFPNAHVVIAGYYPVVSDRTPHDLFMRALAKRFYAPAEPNGRRPRDKELLARLALVSATWHEASNSALEDAVARVNEQLAAKGSRQKVMFARILFLPEHAFGTRDTRLWSFDGSMLRKLLALITLGRISLQANDEVRGLRSTVCNDFYKGTRDETADERRARRENRLICRVAALAHPNRKGAVVYADAIKEQLLSFIRNPGWLRSVPATAPTSP